MANENEGNKAGGEIGGQYLNLKGEGTKGGEIAQQYLNLKGEGTKGGEIAIQYLNLRAEGTKGGLLIKDLFLTVGRPPTDAK
jgi:hypothetical protein